MELNDFLKSYFNQLSSKNICEKNNFDNYDNFKEFITDHYHINHVEIYNYIKYVKIKRQIIKLKEESIYIPYIDKINKIINTMSNVNTFPSINIKKYLCRVNVIFKLIEDKKPIEIILCGHSLGGVLAHIIGVYLGFYMQDVVKAKRLSIHIITANAPPIGNKNFNLLVPYVGIKNFWRFYNFQDFVPHYGYLGTWIESKKFRHLDFMLKEGVSDSYNSIGRKIRTKVENTNIFVNDFGVNLKDFLEKIPASVKLNNKYIFHDLFVLDSKKKSVFI